MSLAWSDPAGYESYVGRWSRVVAPSFLEWLGASAGGHWLDVGCGTGVLIEAILSSSDPLLVTGLDKSPAYLAHAKKHLVNRVVSFSSGDASVLPYATGAFDAVISGLVLNLLDADAALAEQIRVARGGARVGAYVWDYAGEYEFVKYFWEAARSIDESAARYDPAVRFPICRQEALLALFSKHGLIEVRTTQLTAFATLPNFDAYWAAINVRQGSLAEYLTALDADRCAALRERLAQIVPAERTGVLRLKLSAFAVSGMRAAQDG